MSEMSLQSIRFTLSLSSREREVRVRGSRVSDGGVRGSRVSRGRGR
jgi:hypothetical protein